MIGVDEARATILIGVFAARIVIGTLPAPVDRCHYRIGRWTGIMSGGASGGSPIQRTGAGTGLVTLVCASPAGAKDLIRRTTPGRDEAVISLNDHQFSGRAIDCMTPDFTAGFTRCALPGGGSLSTANG